MLYAVQGVFTLTLYSDPPNSYRLAMRLNLFCWLSVLAAVCFAPGLAAEDRGGLKAIDLAGGQVPAAPLNTAVFTPVAATKPGNKFPGRLVLAPHADGGRIDVLRDGRDRTDLPANRVDQLPPMAFDLVQSGDDLVPLQRGLVSGTHPYWEWFVGPGKAWDEPGDAGWTRAVLPFALQERNQNCTHNGLLSFLYRSDGRVSQVYYQVGSETCTYLRVDLWGMAPASTSFATEPVAGATVAAFRRERGRRLPVRPMAQLASDFPGADPAAFTPPSVDDVTVYGLVADGVHYRAGCETRHGPYPLCDELHLPSYSTAKSVYAGLGVMRMARLWPEFPGQAIASQVTACGLGDGRWSDVSVDDALDMTTGNFVSSTYMADEDDLVWNFLRAESHADKASVACGEYPRAATPGNTWVYHTSDTYLVATAMNAFLQARRGVGQDAYRDLLVDDLWRPLGLSPVTHTTLRTFDAVAQGFGGLGLTFLPDDVARIGQFLGVAGGRIDGQAMFDAEMLDQALFRGAGATPEHKATALFAYSNGFWGAPGHVWAGCENDTWIPHMSGFGGITIALLPNGMTYYVFADSGQFQWSEAAAEANRQRDFCS